MSNQELTLNQFNIEEVATKIDHTILKATAKEQDILKLCEEAYEYRFASVCIQPQFVTLAAKRLLNSDVAVCTVIGFPLGANASEVKAFEAQKAVSMGATEVDMVIPIGALKAGNTKYVLNDIADVVRQTKKENADTLVKVIIETCYLTDDEKRLACQLAEQAGANFVKTSTGFGSGGATLEDVILMRKTVSSNVKVKASGGIRTAESALEFIHAGADRLGTSSGVNIINELKSFQ